MCGPAGPLTASASHLVSRMVSSPGSSRGVLGGLTESTFTHLLILKVSRYLSRTERERTVSDTIRLRQCPHLYYWVCRECDGVNIYDHENDPEYCRRKADDPDQYVYYDCAFCECVFVNDIAVRIDPPTITEIEVAL